MDYLRREAVMMRNRMNAWRRLYEESMRQPHLHLKTDLGSMDRLNLYSRLHSKIYLNNRYAIIGSANFTRMGVVKGGNWECIIIVPNDKPLYSKIRNEAEQYIRKSKTPDECEKRLVKTLKELFKPLQLDFTTIDDVIAFIEELMP